MKKYAVVNWNTGSNPCPEILLIASKSLCLKSYGEEITLEIGTDLVEYTGNVYSYTNTSGKTFHVDMKL